MSLLQRLRVMIVGLLSVTLSIGAKTIGAKKCGAWRDQALDQ